MMTIAVMGREEMDDITFCIDECHEFSCERNPENIMHPELPHSFAHLQQTEYCPLWRQEIEKVEVVRCRDCKYRLNHYCHHEDTYDLYVHMEGYCSRGERRDDTR